MPANTRLPVSDINPHLLCVLCGGYLIDATVSTECLHAFCKTCIIKYTESCKTCPICDTLIHKTRPTENLRADKALQSLVYKLIPNLFQDEMKRRREFYAKTTMSDPVASSANQEEARGQVTSVAANEDDEQVSLCLQMADRFPPYKNNSTFTNSGKERMHTDCRYLLCPSQATVHVLQKFLRHKFDISPSLRVDLFHSDERLDENFSLQDIYTLYGWLRKKPFKLFYLVYDPVTVTIPKPLIPKETVPGPIMTSTVDKSHDFVVTSNKETVSDNHQKITIKLKKSCPLRGVSHSKVKKPRKHEKKPITLTIKTSSLSKSSEHFVSSVSTKPSSSRISKTSELSCSESSNSSDNETNSKSFASVLRTSVHTDSEQSRSSTPLSRFDSFGSNSTESSSSGISSFEDGGYSSSEYSSSENSPQKLAVDSIDSGNNGIKIRIRRASCISGEEKTSSSPEHELVSAEKQRSPSVPSVCEKSSIESSCVEDVATDNKTDECYEKDMISTESEVPMDNMNDVPCDDVSKSSESVDKSKDISSAVDLCKDSASVAKEPDLVVDLLDKSSVVDNSVSSSPKPEDISVPNMTTPQNAVETEGKSGETKCAQVQSDKTNTDKASPVSAASCIVLVPSSNWTSSKHVPTNVLPPPVLKNPLKQSSKILKTKSNTKALWSPAKELSSLPVLKVPSPHKIMASLARNSTSRGTHAHGSHNSVCSSPLPNDHTDRKTPTCDTEASRTYSRIAPKPFTKSPAKNPTQTTSKTSPCKPQKRPLAPRVNSKAPAFKGTDCGPLPCKVPKMSPPLTHSKLLAHHYPDAVHSVISLAPPVVLSPAPPQQRSVFSPGFHYPHSPIFNQYQYSPYHHHNSPPHIPLVYTALSPEAPSPSAICEEPLELTTQPVRDRHHREPGVLSASSRRMS